MIEIGERGTDPILESLDGIVRDWDDAGLIQADSHIIEIDLKHGDGKIEIVISEGLGTEGNPYRV